MEEKIKRLLTQSTINMPKEKRALIEGQWDRDLDLTEIVGFLLVRERALTSVVLALAEELDRRKKEH